MFGMKSAAQTVDTVKIDTEVLLRTTGSNSKKELVGAIDQGTSSSRFLLFTKEGKIAAWAQKETTQIFPSEEGTVGWHEHDPMEIWRTIVDCIKAVIEAMDKEVKKHNNKFLSGYSIAAIGITNQRETTVAWNAVTGQPYYNAIVWDDTRTVSIASHIAQGDDDRLRDKTGLPLASYFAGTKVRWLLDNVDALQKDIDGQPEVVRFGTIDTWILYQLTGTPAKAKNSLNVGGLFVTDVSNASRWLFLDLVKVDWDKDLVKEVCEPHNVPLTALPEIKASSEIYAILQKDSTGIDKLQGVPVSAILGDQQAALFGQVAFEPGEAKNTYGTGMFLMMNTGTKLVPSTHGLLTTIAYKISDEVVYALEGSVSHSGSTIQWLRDQLGLLKSATDSEELASGHNDGLYMVPAFAGLFAPHWRPDARGCVVGITAAHHKGHIIRAALEAAAYQAREVFEAIEADSNVELKALKVDGGGSHNNLMMQFQADMINAPVVIPQVQETTAMGAAFAAGLAVEFWKDKQEIKSLWNQAGLFTPLMSEQQRESNWEGWKKAIKRSLDWVETEEDDEFVDAREGTDSSVIRENDDKSTSKNNTKDSDASGKSMRAFISLVLGATVAGGAGFLLGRRKR
ncbi:unnamed protein product [Pseudo-nitzschia multistriata]|uniref:glycerol kinase n=1 Tax=Pseudo-nitzschia multistriata TaxID=183589 RepID=A0A448Z2R1_9STRA|nr:unnamed protein product [Pseudo-nitzschia multistriata]